MKPMNLSNAGRVEYLNSIHPAYVKTLTERSICAVLYRRRGISFEYRADPDGQGGYNYYLVSACDQEDKHKRFYYTGDVLKSFRRIEAEREYMRFVSKRLEAKALKDMVIQMKAENSIEASKRHPAVADIPMHALNPENDFVF